MIFEKEKVFSFDEFFKIQRNGEFSKSRLDKITYKLTSNKKLKKIILLSIASVLSIQDVVYAVDGVGKLDVAGNKLLNIFRYFGKFACLFFCFAEIIKSLAEGDVKSIGKIILKYSIAFSSFYFLPWLFEVIKECFE